MLYVSGVIASVKDASDLYLRTYDLCRRDAASCRTATPAMPSLCLRVLKQLDALLERHTRIQAQSESVFQGEIHARAFEPIAWALNEAGRVLSYASSVFEGGLRADGVIVTALEVEHLEALISSIERALEEVSSVVELDIILPHGDGATRPKITID